MTTHTGKVIYKRKIHYFTMKDLNRIFKDLLEDTPHDDVFQVAAWLVELWSIQLQISLEFVEITWSLYRKDFVKMVIQGLINLAYERVISFYSNFLEFLLDLFGNVIPTETKDPEIY